MEDFNDYKLLVLIDGLKKENDVTLRERWIMFWAKISIPDNSRKLLEAADECKADVLIKKVDVGDLRITPDGREQIPVLWRVSVYGNMVKSKWCGYVSLATSILALAISAYTAYRTIVSGKY